MTPEKLSSNRSNSEETCLNLLILCYFRKEAAAVREKESLLPLDPVIVSEEEE